MSTPPAANVTKSIKMAENAKNKNKCKFCKREVIFKYTSDKYNFNKCSACLMNQNVPMVETYDLFTKKEDIITHFIHHH